MADPARVARSCTNRGKFAGGAGCQGGTERSCCQGAGSCKSPGKAGDLRIDSAGSPLILLGPEHCRRPEKPEAAHVKAQRLPSRTALLSCILKTYRTVSKFGTPYTCLSPWKYHGQTPHVGMDGFFNHTCISCQFSCAGCKLCLAWRDGRLQKCAIKAKASLAATLLFKAIATVE